MIKGFLKTTQMTYRQQTNGGIIYLLPNILVKLIYLLPLLFLWRAIIANGINVDMSLQQMLTYTYINALLSEMLLVKTMASSWSYEGQLMNLYTRPMSIYGQIISQTIGGWIPMLLIFSLPMLIIGPIFGISIIPSSSWFFPSLILCISLGFAIDFIFACLTIRLKGMSWLVYVIRMAIISLFSGTIIPFRLLPFGLEKIFAFQPFGSLGGAPLSLFVGIANPIKIILTQLFWNVILWPLAIIWFKKSQERMVSYGG